jgi:hypothetical protein
MRTALATLIFTVLASAQNGTAFQFPESATAADMNATSIIAITVAGGKLRSIEAAEYDDKRSRGESGSS